MDKIIKNGLVIIIMTEAEYIEQTFGIEAKPVEQSVESDLFADITKVLREIGVPAHIKGFRYLREAILIVAENPEAINSVVKGLYVDIAKVNGDTPSRVERAMRHAIETGFSRITTDMIVKYFDNMDYIKNKPTNSEFIATIADNLMLARR